MQFSAVSPYSLDTTAAPDLTFAHEMWIMKTQTEQQLSILERKILCKLCGLNKWGDGSWRIKSSRTARLGLLERKEEQWL
jgi:hypothetical protein